LQQTNRKVVTSRVRQRMNELLSPIGMDFAVNMSYNARTSQSWDRLTSYAPCYLTVLSKTLKETK
jgi:hypothetical protein